ncbi:MAG: hypothetical protein DMF80_10500 [Acidobacteria bacterium]|nr:MAG: hypothetical protein DMF80_10500 [Acidobacteriota bacterium]
MPGHVRRLRVRAAADEPRSHPLPQHDQGPSGPGLERREPPLGAGQRRPALQLRLPGRITLYGLSIYDVDSQRWQLRDVLYVASAAWNGMSYDVERGWRRAFGDRASFHELSRARTREIEPPSYFGQEERAADTLRFRELQAHIASLEALGVDVIPLRVQLHHKLAYPFVCVVMTLLGIPFSFVVARRGALYGIGASIVIAIVYSPSSGRSATPPACLPPSPRVPRTSSSAPWPCTSCSTSRRSAAF